MPTNSLYPEMTATPRNKLAGLLADALTGMRDFADRARVPDAVPLLGGQGVGSMFLGKAPEEVNELSYGNLPIQINPYAGRTASYVPEMKRGRGQQVADALSLLPLPGAKTVAGGLLGMPGADAAMFIGSKAKTWDAAAAARAVEMEKAGVPAQSIWSETGTLRGPDGLLRQEIDDRSAKLVLGKLQPDAYGAIEAKTFDGALKHQQLRRAYPELSDVTFQHWPNESFQGASFDPSENLITLGHQAMKPSEGATFHELQHAIQQREGFSQGGNPEMFNQQKDAELARDALDWARELRRIRSTQPGMDPIAAENKAIQDYQQMGALEFVPSREARDLARQPGVLFDSPNAFQSASDLEALSKMYGLDQRTTPYTAQEAYRRLAGEAEARATQARMNMTPAERRATFPLDSYDVPINQLIIR